MTSTTPAAPPASPAAPVPPFDDALGPFTDDRPCAPWGLRVLATLLDSALIASVAFLATGHAPTLAALPGVGQDADAPDAPTAAWIAGTLLVLGALQAYTGMTPGKRVAGIAVVDDRSGRPIGLPGTVLRWFAHVIDTILLIGYLRSAFRRDGRTFADSLLGTVAVRTTTPEPHPLVARLRAARDARAPRLRWPRRVTYAVALVLCAAAAAMSLVSGSGDRTEGPVGLAGCTVTSPDVAGSASAVVVVEHTVTSTTRLGIRRDTEETWTVGAYWDVPAEWSSSGLPVPQVDMSPPGGGFATPAPGEDRDIGAVVSAGGSDALAANPLVTHDDIVGWSAIATLVSAGGVELGRCERVLSPALFDTMS